MQASYHLTINELTDDFIHNLKNQFKSGILDIVVSEADETDYLLSTKNNREHLEESINEIENNIYISKTLKDLEL